jgi:hypothetical protein
MCAQTAQHRGGHPAIDGAFGSAPDFPMPDRSDSERQRWIDQMMDKGE